MKKSTKAAILSALVFPGMGHFYLKKHIIGSFILGITFIPLYVVVTNAIEQAQAIVDKILSGEVQGDIASITDMVSKQSSGIEAQSMDFAVIVLIVIWLIAVIDAHRRGRALDKNTGFNA